MFEVVEKLEIRLNEVDKELVSPDNLSDRKKLIELNRERRHIDDTLKTGLEDRRVARGIPEAWAIREADKGAQLVGRGKEGVP